MTTPTTIRPLRLSEDYAQIERLETSFKTDRIYQLHASGLSFRLDEVVVEPPIHKVFPWEDELAELARGWEYAVVAEHEGAIVGLAVAGVQAWNNRAVLHHLYVAPEHRRKGIGRLLLADAASYAKSRGARCLWLEATNVNYPAIQFYLRAGFCFCGLDTSLYDPRGPAAGEVALFLAYDLGTG